MRNYKPTATSSKQNTQQKLVFAREGVFYGLLIQNEKSDKVSFNQGITSTPTFVFYSNNTKCLIDYTSQTNELIESTIESYFSQISSGTTFYVYNGYYIDTNLNRIADLSGEYIFRNYYNGIIEADVVSVESFSTNINRYDKARFEQIPFLVANVFTQKEEVQSIIKNRFGKNTKNSFNYLGAKVGDYIKLSDITSQLKILEINTDPDGNEYILVDRKLNEADLTNIKTKINLYVPYDGKIEPIFENIQNSQEIGSCVEYLNGIQITCTNNHTREQCFLRGNVGSSSSPSTNFNPSSFCSVPETSSAVQTDTTTTLLQMTNALATTLTNMNNMSGVIRSGSGVKSAFYGRQF